MMGLTIRERADTIATFRYLSVYLMELLARWVPTVPELEVKVLMGRHIWEFAQHADALGRRTGELRAPLHHSLRPVDAYHAVLDQVNALTGSADRMAALYGALLPDLERRYRRYIEDTNPLLDEPSVRVIERILHDFPRLATEAEATLRDRNDLAAEPGLAERFTRALAETDRFVAHRAAPALEGV